MIEGQENIKTTLDDDASIYARRDTRPTKEKFKDLHGKAKWQYFRDYMLAKLIGLIIGIACLAYFAYSILKPTPEAICYVAVLDSPLAEASEDSITEKLTAALVEDEEKEKIVLDTDFYVSSDGYSSRAKLMTYIAAGDIDCIILPESEFNTYMQSGIFNELYTLLTPGELGSIEELLIYHATYVGDDENGDPIYDETSEGCYAVNVTAYINALNGFETNTDYYLTWVANSEHSTAITAVLEALGLAL